MTETFYEVLGVAEDATTDEIESAYRERLKETHPDVSDDEDAERATQQLIEARDVLVDEKERERYDRLGHAAYTGEGTPSTDSASSAGGTATETSTDTGTPGAHRDRGSRERRARQRVSEERRRQSRAATSETSGTGSAGATAGTTSGSRTASATATASETGRRRPGKHVREEEETDSEVQYSVRTDVSTPSSYGPLLPRGHRLTLLGIFLALYPVLLFSALLPAFPLLVNLVVGVCLVVTVGYLQSMPRVGLLVFGFWSAVAVFLVLVTGIPVLSLVGLAILGGTLFPFALSILTASALRY